MNRAEYRRQQKEVAKNNKTYNLSNDQIKQMKLDVMDEAIKRTLTLTIGFSFIVLRDKFGFGKKRLEMFQEEFLNQYECLDKGYMTFDDIKRVITEETGMQIVEKIKPKKKGRG